MDSAYSRYKEMLLTYGERLSTLGIDQLEEILTTMSNRREQWGNDYSFALAQEIKKRGHLIDYTNYKIIYYNEETNP
jgi:hypothetical protein